MNRVMIPLLTSSMMTSVERQHGRFMRAPDGHEGFVPPPPPQAPTGESGQQTNNQGGNAGESGNPPPAGDNAGQGTPLEGFWNTKPEEPATGESVEQQRQESQAIGGELRGMIDGFAAPPVFTKEVAEQIAEGNFDAANAAIAKSHQAAIQQGVLASAKLIQAVVSKIQADFETRIQTALGNKDSSDFLQQKFPQAKDPALAPLVERVWNQALVNSKGNREQAVTLTRGMLQAMGKEFAPDDIRNPPEDPTAGINTAASRSLVESLLAR